MVKSVLLTIGFYVVLIMLVSLLGPLGAGELAVTAVLALLFFAGDLRRRRRPVEV